MMLHRSGLVAGANFALMELALAYGMSPARWLGRKPDTTLDRWADDGGPVPRTPCDTPTPPIVRMTRQQRRWKAQHPTR